MAIPLMVAGTLTQVAGQLNQAQSQAAANEYNAKVAEQNASLARQQSIEQERQVRIQSRKQLGDIRSSYAASGVSIEGSPLDILEESAATAELDALTVRHGGEVKARAFESEAAINRFSAKQARIGGYLGAASTLLKGGSSVYGSSGGGGGKSSSNTTSDGSMTRTP